MPRPKKDTEAALVEITKELFGSDANISDLGTILGCLGDDTVKWLQKLKKECTSIEEFIDMARSRADIALIAAAVKEATGYDYDEIEIEYIKVADGYDENNKPIIREIEGKKKIKKKKARGNDSLLRFILKCRLPEYFQDLQKVEINKKTIEIKEIAEKEIKEFGRQLLETFEQKEAKFEDTK